MGWTPAPKKPRPSAAAVKDNEAKPEGAESDLAKAQEGDQRRQRRRGKPGSAEKARTNAKARARKAQPGSGPGEGRNRAGQADRAGPGLGSRTSRPAAIGIEAQLEQKGAGIESVYSSRYDAEFENGWGKWLASVRSS